MQSLFQIKYDNNRSHLVAVINKGQATWFINGQCYGAEKNPQSLVHHYEAMLGWDNPITLQVAEFVKHH